MVGSLKMRLSLAQRVVDMAALAEAREGATEVVDLAIQGMSCASCVGRVEKALARVPGVAGAAMAFSSVSVVSNALLLRRWRPAVAEVKHG
jgi:cation transport ATPase